MSWTTAQHKTTGSAKYTTEQAHAFELHQMKARFNVLNPRQQNDERNRVLHVLYAEKRRAPKQHSALWHRAKPVYGIDPEQL